MTVQQQIKQLDLTVFHLEDGDRKIENVYCGDLLSWVMGRAPDNCCWLTIMTNQNVAAVGVLIDCACIVLAEGVQPDSDLTARCAAQGVTLLGSPLGEYELCWRLKQLLE